MDCQCLVLGWGGEEGHFNRSFRVLGKTWGSRINSSVYWLSCLREATSPICASMSPSLNEQDNYTYVVSWKHIWSSSSIPEAHGIYCRPCATEMVHGKPGELQDRAGTRCNEHRIRGWDVQFHPEPTDGVQSRHS